MSRTIHAYASAYDRYRVHCANLRRDEVRRVTANFSALLVGDEAIESATWYCSNPSVVAMSDAVIDGAETYITGAFQLGGVASLKAVITTDAGNSYTQQFEFTVADCPSFYQPAPVSAGPLSLTASA